MEYMSKICDSMHGNPIKTLCDGQVILVITVCRDSKNIGRQILADLNYWRKIDNGNV